MGYVNLILKAGKALTKSKSVASSLTSKTGTAFRIKPEITMPVRAETIKSRAFAIPIDKRTIANPEVQGELGNIAIRHADKLKTKEKYSNRLANDIFGDISEVKTSSVRTKDANSIYSKYEKNVKDGKVIGSEADAHEYITDAVGMRFQMRSLTHDEAIQAIKAAEINGKKLTNSEQRLVKRLFKNDKTLTPSEIAKAEELALPVKMILAEKQTKPVFDRMLLCNIKSALQRKVTTLDKLKQSGFSEEFLSKLNDPQIKPLRLTRICNYKGLDGIPYYSDNQMMSIEKLVLATGEDIKIQHCPSSIDLNKYKISELTKDQRSAIRDSGYVTTQMNVTLPDGTLAEVQFRGSSLFAEYEHIAYDSRQLKNTLGKTFDKYKEAIRSLSPKEYEEYNNYLRKCYNYYRNKELGLIVSQKPKLDKKLPQILSQESMENLYKLNHQRNKQAMETFTPHLELVA